VAGTPTAFAAADNPASRDPSLLTRFYTFSYLPVFNFFLLLYPFHLSFDWSMESIPKITTISDPRNLCSIVFYAVLCTVTIRTIKNEIRKKFEFPLKDGKYPKKQNCKTARHKGMNLKQHSREQEIFDLKTYLASSDKANHEIFTKNKLCSLVGCRHPLTKSHTSACRSINNNNNLLRNSACVCSIVNLKLKLLNFQRNAHRSHKVAFLTFMAFMILPFVPATNMLFYVGFVVAERVMYIPSVGFCLLLGLGAGILMRRWQLSETKTRIFLLTILIALSSMSCLTIHRNLDWYDEESLFKSAVHINPPKGKNKNFISLYLTFL
jgi:protein O-mannosyl-transferase